MTPGDVSDLLNTLHALVSGVIFIAFILWMMLFFKDMGGKG